MPVDAALISGGVNILGGVLKGITGGGQRRQGKKLLNQIGEQPIEQMPSEITANQTLAGIRANTGMPSEQYNMAMQNIQRQQARSLMGAGDRRGGLSMIGSLQQGSDDAAGKIDAQSANMRLANQKDLMNVNNTAAGWKSKLFQQNILNPYMRKYNYAMNLLGSGNQNISNGIEQGVAGLGNIGLGVTNATPQQTGYYPNGYGYPNQMNRGY
jgi:hypothetical protein